MKFEGITGETYSAETVESIAKESGADMEMGRCFVRFKGEEDATEIDLKTFNSLRKIFTEKSHELSSLHFIVYIRPGPRNPRKNIFDRMGSLN